MTTAHITIDLSDVHAAGNVAAAIEAWCEQSDDTSSGIIGPSFATSGPGSGWSQQHTESDYARRAFEAGVLYYVDSSDGRIREAESVDASEIEGDELPDDVYQDMSGCYYRAGDWSDESCVRIECPEYDDAMQYPEIVAEMARAVIDHHGPESDGAAWATLVRAIKDAADALDGIDPDDLRTASESA